MTTYQQPVSQLLTYGDHGEFNVFSPSAPPDYHEQFGITEEHIPELMRMLTDEELLSMEDDIPKYYAPAHALLALGQLRVKDAIDTIIQMFHEWDSHELIWEYYPPVMSQLAPDPIPKLEAYLADDSHSESARGHAATCVYQIAQDHDEHRETCVEILTGQLAHYEDNGYVLNAEIIASLARLREESALPLIEKAYDADVVEGFFISLDDVRQLMAGKFYPPSMTQEQIASSTSRKSSNKKSKADPKKKKKRKKAKKSKQKNRKK